MNEATTTLTRAACAFRIEFSTICNIVFASVANDLIIDSDPIYSCITVAEVKELSCCNLAEILCCILTKILIDLVCCNQLAETQGLPVDYFSGPLMHLVCWDT